MYLEYEFEWLAETLVILTLLFKRQKMIMVNIF